MEPYLRINLGEEYSGKRLSMSQIVGAISQQILSDSSLSGCRLPPIRVLAHQLGVSKNTVSAAYEELKAKALIESRGRTGLFIATHHRQSPPFQDSKKVPLPALKPVNPIGKNLERREEMIFLSSVFIDPSLFPKERLANCFRSVLKNPGLASYADPQGFLPLRQKIAQRLRRRGVDAEPEQIITTVGSQQVLDLVCRSMESKVIATENPAYPMGKALFEMNGMKPVGLPVEPFKGIPIDEWEKILRLTRPGLVYLTSNFQNPTGYSYSSYELAQIIEWSQKYGFGILEDDWGSDMLSYSEFKPSLRSLGGENVLYMNSFTKKLLPSLRLGYVVGSSKSIPSLVMSKSLSVSGTPPLIEAALFEFLDRGYYDSYLKQIQKELDRRYQNCLDLLRKYMPDNIRWTSPGGGPILWLELPDRIQMSQLSDNLKKRGVQILPSEEAFFGKPHLHGFKIGYAALSEKEMEFAIRSLSDCLMT